MFIDDIFNELLFCIEKQENDKTVNCSIYDASINVQNKNKCLVVISSTLDKNSVTVLFFNEFFNKLTLTNINDNVQIKSKYFSLINLTLHFNKLTKTKKFVDIKTFKMENIKNEKYKGIDIAFDPITKLFSFNVDLFFLGKHSFESKIIGACKKQINELLSSEEKISESESQSYQEEKFNFETVYGG